MEANPTGVNPFTGRSDDTKAAGVFEPLWQKGALDSQDPAEAAQLQAGREKEAAQQASLKGEPEQAAQPDSPTPPPQKSDGEAEASSPEYVNLDDYLAK